ncbi:MAG: YlxR family protein [Firmicutes bacterium]|nr:YlxR family protein [Bacillota bacterium]
MRKKHVPMRTCVGCRTAAPKRDLIRVVRSPEGEVNLDLTGKRPGRGVYICSREECLDQAIKTRQLERALQTTIDEQVVSALKKVLLDEQSSQQGL